MTRVWVQRAAIIAVWIAAIVAWRSYQTSNDLGAIDAAQRFVDAIDDVWWGWLAFTVAYLLRPLLLFPASVMTVAAGLLFGAVGGVLVVVVAANASAMIAYAIGRSLAGRSADPMSVPGDDERAGLVARWGRRLRERSFETVFLMRLLFLPYDLVNYVSGALRVRWTAFLLATVLGTLPGTVSFVLLGASLERLDQGLDGINPWAIVASVAIFVASLLVARIARSRPSGDTAAHPSDPDPSAVATRTSTPTTTPTDEEPWLSTTRHVPTAPPSSGRAPVD